MYEKLVKMLRVCGDSNNSCGNCPVRENDGSCPHGEWEFAAEKYMLQAADAIEQLSNAGSAYGRGWTLGYDAGREESKPRWISVTEQPPLKVGDDGYNGYLIYANGHYAVADYTTDKFDNVPYFHVNGEYEPDVTHWMPLPPAPKEE